MLYTINIHFTDGSFVLLGAYTATSALILLQHVFTSEVKSFSIQVNDND